MTNGAAARDYGRDEAERDAPRCPACNDTGLVEDTRVVDGAEGWEDVPCDECPAGERVVQEARARW